MRNVTFDSMTKLFSDPEKARIQRDSVLFLSADSDKRPDTPVQCSCHDIFTTDG